MEINVCDKPLIVNRRRLLVPTVGKNVCLEFLRRSVCFPVVSVLVGELSRRAGNCAWVRVAGVRVACRARK